MNLSRLSWPLALIVALVMGFGAAGGAAAAPAADELPQTKNPSSVRFDMSGSIEVNGSVVPINGRGAAMGNNVMLDMELSAPAGASGPETVSMSMIMLDNKLYIKMSGISADTDDKWFVTDVQDAMMGGMTGGMMGGPGMGVPGAMTGIDPAMIANAMTVTRAGPESLNGTATTRYDVRIDPTRINMPGMDEQARAALAGTAMGFSLWVGDADMYVHRFAMSVENTSTGEGVSATVRMQMTMDFSDFDAPVSITAPANAEPLNLTLGGTPGMGPGGIVFGGPLGMPGMTTGMGTGMPRTGSGSSAPLWPFMLLGAAALGAGVAVRRRSLPDAA